ncbi:DNA-directed RNA polymerase III subunit RPC7-like [Physella acuta]|uniref:DNA-directed RNA polymerase III subunit RPC7-like n=1 Tax=Physella acuta TaxID=109671 RepID=UPI0027DD3F02|nr:DNA-directed RNA polymerase III subunit RPC7-like [Physella acuta]XP_059145844.1 DNA-directed RNA polymerase III subunit RPC7-like [Physella acuta]XP_059145845.1 DNA-directed RNA polymerase III subunit RPC7-like [Physella acuta]
MGGRGRGRGRGMSINIEALGLGRGEILPTVAHPPPLYPPLMYKPVPLSQSDDMDYMLALKQELRESFHKSPCYIKAPNKIKDIERYSDKYQLGTTDSMPGWSPDWSRFPAELQERVKRKKPVAGARNTAKLPKLSRDEDVSKLLEKLEQGDAKTENLEDIEAHEEGDDEEKKTEKEEGDEDDEEELDDEEIEEETDYNLDYFDNGEGYGDDDEDDDEGPTY